MAGVPGRETLHRQPGIELGKAAEALLLGVLPDPAAGVLDPLLDAALLPARRDIAEVRLEEVVRRHRRKARIDDPAAIRAGRAVDRRLHVVVDAPPGDAAQAGQTARVRVKQHLVPLTGIAHQPEGPRRTQLHVRQLHLAPHAADDETFFAPVKLKRLAPRETQRHIRSAGGHRSLLRTPGANEFRDAPVAAHKSLLLQLCVELPRRPPPTARPTGVSRQRLAKARLVRADLLGAR